MAFEECSRLASRWCGRCRCFTWRRRGPGRLPSLGGGDGDTERELAEVMLLANAVIDSGTGPVASGSWYPPVPPSPTVQASEAQTLPTSSSSSFSRSQASGARVVQTSSGSSFSSRSQPNSARVASAVLSGNTTLQEQLPRVHLQTLRAVDASLEQQAATDDSVADWRSHEVAREQMTLPGERPGASYTSMEAAVILSLLNHEQWSLSYIRDEDGGEGDSECRVCLVEYEPGDKIVRLPCMHYAHARCMENWLIRAPRCPVCQTNLREALQCHMGS
eukprot:TRINITY_DN32492_c0_g1_i1.p1 TRINITY_DN32492_c0_g1~~TRINITY_DN32492_c0_g1_i1.p1  ORF type:complete len:288 (+),score=48.19 TRINITY_DN32492_c0_g1_i1:37-864(+)